MIFLLILLAVLLALTGAAFTYTAMEQRNAQRFLRIVSEQQLLSQQLAAASLEATSGQAAGFRRLEQERAHFSSLMQALQHGDPARNLPPLPQALRPDLNALNKQWSASNQAIGQIVAAQKPVADIASYVNEVNKLMPKFFGLSDQVTSRLIATGASTKLVYMAQRQSFLVQRIQNSINRLLFTSGEGSATALSSFSNNVNLYGQIMQGMLSGGTQLTLSQAVLGGVKSAYSVILNGKDKANIPQVKDPEARAKLRQVAVVLATLDNYVKAIGEAAPKLFAAKAAVVSLQADARNLLATSKNLEQALVTHNQRLSLFNIAGYVFGALALLTLIILGAVLTLDNKRELALTTEQNRRNQRAILRLLDEMTNLADGDLTVHATVTEDITGAIADSVNYAIDALRSLVATINQTAVQVAAASEKTQSTALHLADASNHQAREIASASAAVTDMADSIEHMAANAMDSADVAKKSVEIAARGATTVRRSIDGMDTIREQIQDTSKRIKRLGESSQEIGDIVGLINDIADQTNILALNAAIQASAAGEAGRGFAVVADEVQRLAERSANATRQIEVLVKTIQADTNEAVNSMERSTSNVVSGGQLAADAGEALAEIESVSNQLAQQIMGIANSARQQAAVASNVTNTMNVIQEITLQTSEGSNETAQSIGQLAALAADLRTSVAGFKLPDSEDEATFVLEDNEIAG
ncbi:chemotaxis protein [Acidihalobacter ferrooxydans]|uniref:Chemotaxis protein n=1 Tax=Acidihalobacter ferrooxydans TaxID=1765967 RepID=A0A1P8ULP3_9GAMM|nr:chemotaxis protein [Acidihalobacter ferrooxydans]